MPNYPMLEKLKSGEAIDVSECQRWQEDFYDVTKIFKGLDADVDYCDAKKETWIWSIAKHKVTGNIYASGSTYFQNSEDFEVVWLR